MCSHMLIRTNLYCMVCCSLRALLHKSIISESSGGGQSPKSDYANIEKSQFLVRKIVKDSLSNLGNGATRDRSIRWELGSCWVQHLQKQETSVENSSKKDQDDSKNEPVVKGLGKQFKMLKKRGRKPNSLSSTEDNDENSCTVSSSNIKSSTGELNNVESECAPQLRNILPEEAYQRLKETGTGLHLKVSGTIH